MALNAIHDTIDDIPEPYRDLYTEKNGKYELTGIAGVKTQADIDRLSTALEKERNEHKGTKEKYSVWGDLDHSEVMSKLDKYPELEAAAKGKLDENAIEEIVTRRVEGTLSSKVSPLERQIANLTKERDSILAERDQLVGEKRTRTIHDNVRDALTKAKVIPEAHEDALMLAERIFEIREDDGAVVTRDNVGVTPGVTADLWLSDLQEKRPHWWAPSQGGGAGQGAGRGGPGGFAGGANPWSAEGWNLTKQGQYVQQHGAEKAAQMARMAGTTYPGGLRPKPKSAA